ncbi:MAG: geranylgeranylglyceryl/heptaprenylglyceryl phosphate synthase [Thaumarchaeota archaeon]|nr:geranylgeranylglyceryl/heptaprenylglyceryl phosphate synthase [Nitrososphaerota archaeon]
MPLVLGKTEGYLIQKTKKGTIIAGLIDPEDFSSKQAASVASNAEKHGISAILVGGSTISDQGKLDSVVRAVKKAVRCPVILFPGNVTGVSHHADAILFSSLLNSTNPYFLIGAQAIGSMKVFRSKLESIPMGYLVFGDSSTTSFIGQVKSIPLSKPNIAVIYALAAQYLGMRTLYLEAGSGSAVPIPRETIALVRKFYDGLLIVGGGITTSTVAERAAGAGADIIVIGNLLEKPGYEKTITEMTSAIGRN